MDIVFVRGIEFSLLAFIYFKFDICILFFVFGSPNLENRGFLYRPNNSRV